MAPSSTRKQKATKTTATETAGLLSEEERELQASEEVEYNDADDFPRKSIAYRMFSVIGALAMLIAALQILAQIATFAILKGNVIQIVLRAYMILFSVFFILAELRVEVFLKYAPSLRNWINRGFLYTFVGVIGVEESYASLALQYPKLPSFKERFTSVFLKIASFAMIFIGILYMIMGILCMNLVYEKVRARYQRQVDRFVQER